MRIITGTLKGRYIEPVPSLKTRPTSDKIKEAVFHIMGPYFEGGHALDLFAGSGSLGIEAISRGMESVTFIDTANEAIKTIKKNIRNLRIDKYAYVFRNDALRALHILSNKQKTFDLIFVDPPYDTKIYSSILQKIQQYNIINPNGLVYIEHVPDKEIKYDEQFYNLYFYREYGKTIATTILQISNSN